MAYNICVSSLCCKDGESNYFNHQLVKISVPKTDMNLFGPAFIEVRSTVDSPLLLGCFRINLFCYCSHCVSSKI